MKRMMSVMLITEMGLYPEESSATKILWILVIANFEMTTPNVSFVAQAIVGAVSCLI
jgi:hypothetical protein